MNRKFEHRAEMTVRRKVGRAVHHYGLLREGDRVLVAVSGGKDSLVLLDILRKIPDWAPIRYELVPFTLDQGFPGFDAAEVRRQVARLGLELVVERAPVSEILACKAPRVSTPCSLCSRLRRGAIYQAAQRLDCHRIALGHHADDLIETLLLNLFFTGELKSMPPLLKAEDGRNVVIRPLCFLFEQEVAAYFEQLGLRAVNAGCPDRQILLRRRRWIKDLLQEWEKINPRVRHSLLAALQHVRADFLLDPRLLSGTACRPGPR
ncbi:MAG: tRNA 2-thiocytidine(32) synthetase TtcA [Acidobacteria bacterium]|nr:tRNA 2-thiocytidine(32) synthetase TtcA [Acidobacteriota bacterium]